LRFCKLKKCIQYYPALQRSEKADGIAIGIWRFEWSMLVQKSHTPLGTDPAIVNNNANVPEPSVIVIGDKISDIRRYRFDEIPLVNQELNEGST